MGVLPKLGYLWMVLLTTATMIACRGTHSSVEQAPVYSMASLLPAEKGQAEPLAPGKIMSLYGQQLGPENACVGYYNLHRIETLSPARPTVAILAAFARLLFVTRHLRAHVFFGAALVLILTDIGYLAYCNSFYSEPASCIFALWFTAEAIFAGKDRTLNGKLVAAALLLICAKPQNAPLALPLTCYMVLVPWRSSGTARFAAAGCLLLAAAAVLHSVQPEPKLEVSYNLLFSAILPESRQPRADLKAMSMDPELVRFQDTKAWSAGSGFHDGQVRESLKHSGPTGLAIFYLQRPARAWRHLSTLFPIATRIRPECCANFEPSSGLAPGAHATTFTLWSELHEQVFGRATKFLLFGLCAILVSHQLRVKPGPLAQVIALLAALCITAFLTAAFGDANEPVKHQFLFNLFLDLTFLLLLASCAGSPLPDLPLSQSRSFLPGGKGVPGFPPRHHYIIPE